MHDTWRFFHRFRIQKHKYSQVTSGFFLVINVTSYGGTSMSREKCDQSIVSGAWKPRRWDWRQTCSQARICSDHFSRLLEINIVHSIVLAFSYYDTVLCFFSRHVSLFIWLFIWLFMMISPFFRSTSSVYLLSLISRFWCLIFLKKKCNKFIREFFKEKLKR